MTDPETSAQRFSQRAAQRFAEAARQSLGLGTDLGGESAAHSAVRIELVQPGRAESRGAGRHDEADVVTICTVSVASKTEWDRALTASLADPLSLLDLLDGHPPPNPGVLAAACPNPDQVEFFCSCEGDANGSSTRCRHKPETARLLRDEISKDGWVLVTLRGGDPAAFITAAMEQILPNSSSGSHRGGAPTGEMPLVPASVLWTRRPHTRCREAEITGDEPAGTTGERFIDPPVGSGIDGADLAHLNRDARLKAQRLLNADPDELRSRVERGAPKPGGFEVLDIVAGRVAHLSASARSSALAHIAARLRVDARRLVTEVEAWILGGNEALQVTLHAWEAEEDDLRTATRFLGEGSSFRANRATSASGAYQLRLSTEGQWFGFRFEDEVGWIIDSGPAATPDRLRPNVAWQTRPR